MTRYAACPECREEMKGLMQDFLRTACHECGGHSLIVLPQEERDRWRALAQQSGRSLPPVTPSGGMAA
jgi:hypothetical protein